MEYFGSTGLLAGLIAFLSLFPLRPFSRFSGLLDEPDHRKTHNGAVPLIGGLSVFIGLFVAWLLLAPLGSGYGVFLLCSLLLVVMGAVDDARHLPAMFRLGAQVALGALLVFGSGVWLDQFGNLLGFGVIELGWLLGPVVTICAVIAATNMFNMIDGIDGLAGSMSLVALLGLLALLVSAEGFRLEITLALALVLAMVPYWLANLRVPPFRSRVFMGDAGSLFIGFSLVWLLTKSTQLDGAAFRPVTALWLVAVPLMDMVAIMLRRARKGQSMMRPDREHLHHIFLRAGFTDRQALVVIVVVAIVMAMIGLAGEWLAVPAWIMCGAFVLLFCGYMWALAHVWRLLVVFRSHRRHREEAPAEAVQKR
ncbi:UDP-GlcNAc:undecaprenyl-phosphate GlcNAc-1-phosphate transferase [Halospina denitrificans]|uniref:Undecaprenyl-phosphate alpha-N-acetylglucosaminyl 1-phosphate transferase n=1 Tax=Halospina denitrificans TaxID=332522 RepID=A0A4R7JY64_9GAMM|nr:UDP-N-acetylglucosamine--undecaprenyl-phosphate N-acetylglucosaminephosphotransferase [Halospina denitrificans]TDT43442.1 UDP-GlcNAc:undecaprenyl-phosphate GlcNAc-1-phosphate transferase [Halospina denitrificans]